jgi:FkbM family methyltransferase
MNADYIINSSNFYIYGAGNTAIMVKNILLQQKKNISSYIISAISSEQNIDGIPINQISHSSGFDTNLPVIIAIFNRDPNAFLPDIIFNLQACGFKKIITFPEFHSLFSKQLGDIFWLTDKNFYSKNTSKYTEVLSMFNDEVSITQYSLIIEYLKKFDSSILIKPDFDNQYFPKDIDVWDGKDTFCDLGSYDGSNIIDAFREKGLLEQVIAFEPDLDNFKKLVTNSLVQKTTKQLLLFPYGVWSETTFLRFNGGSGESSAFDESGGQIIPVVKVDEIVHSKPGYIKFDVEGAEIEALLGGKNTICKHRPSLAISLYHHPDHFYLIPKLIRSWDLDYKFYLRLHGNNLFDTVLYCIK